MIGLLTLYASAVGAAIMAVRIGHALRERLGSSWRTRSKRRLYRWCARALLGALWVGTVVRSATLVAQMGDTESELRAAPLLGAAVALLAAVVVVAARLVDFALDWEF